MELKRVVVTGLGAVTPLGNSVEEFWGNLVNGVSGAGPITRFNAQYHKTKFACEVKNFDVGVYIDKKEARKHDLYTQYAFAVAAQAIEDCGIDLNDNRKLLHTHHANGRKSDNISSNLKVLCVECHSKQPSHEHIRSRFFNEISEIRSLKSKYTNF